MAWHSLQLMIEQQSSGSSLVELVREVLAGMLLCVVATAHALYTIKHRHTVSWTVKERIALKHTLLSHIDHAGQHCRADHVQ